MEQPQPPTPPPSPSPKAHKLPGLHVHALPIELLIDAVPPEQRRLGMFVLAAAFAHLLFFSFIRISYPQPFPRTVPRLYVTLSQTAAPATAQHTSADSWYQLKDPSLLIHSASPLVQDGPISISAFPLPSRVAPPPVSESGSRQETMTFLPDDVSPLADRVTSMMATPHQTFAYATLPAADKAPSTVLSFDSTLFDRLIQPVPALPNQPSGLITESGVSVIRLGVQSDGRVIHALLEQRSGKDSVDATALQYLRKIRFQPTSKPGLVWGQVTVYWQFEPEKTPAAAGTPTAPNKP